MKDWISQADAARLRGVSRQAISKLVQKGRLRTLTIGGHVLVHRDDVLDATTVDQVMDSSLVAELKEHLIAAGDYDRQEIFQWLREGQRLHPLEDEFGVPAEIILEAISRSSDLTKRGVRGVIAEAVFAVEVIAQLDDWTDITPGGDHPFDFLLEKQKERISIQLKMQRRKTHRPMTANQGYKVLSSGYWVVETQRTRGGKDASGEDTRPYKFGEFQILSVSLQPSTGNWGDFLFTLSDWLLPRDNKPEQIMKFQPVPKYENDEWTSNLEVAIEWLQSGTRKRISGLAQGS